MVKLSNNILSIAVKEHGAELASIKKGSREYLWQAYPEYWKRHSPVLFPIVGSVWNSEYRSHGNTYQLGQHGFARDMDFLLVSQSDSEVWYELHSSEETKKKYPYDFGLTIGYRLHDNVVDVVWKVKNTGMEEMSFQIGAHPAFYWPLLSDETIADGVAAMDARLAEDTLRGYFRFHPNANKAKSAVIKEKGCVDPEATMDVILEDGYLAIDTKTFDIDTLILENGQVNAVTLCDQNKNPYLTLKFNTPLVGLWSPPGKNAPFVCIEPWFGRTDDVNYDGEYENRKWIQHLAAGEEFTTTYQIVVE